MSTSQPQVPASITAYKKYGVAPSNIRYAMYNYFHFPEKYKDCLELYAYDVVPYDKFIICMQDGIYIPQWDRDKFFQVIYHQTDPYKLKRRAKHGNSQVKLSFRIAQPEFNIPPTVLVTEI